MKILLGACFCLLFTINIHAQTLTRDAVVSNGGSNNSNSYALEWSMGELATERYTGTTIILSQGFQQNIEKKPLSVQQINQVLSAYPNPTKNMVTLELADVSSSAKWEYSLTDVSGRVVKADHFTSGKTDLSFTDLEAGMYFLTLVNDQNQTHSLRISKID